MKQFEQGKQYKINGSDYGTITVVKRSRCYVTIIGDIPERSGRYMIYSFGKNGLFGMGENILLPIPGVKQHMLFCFACMTV